jgi:hypothetical protein
VRPAEIPVNPVDEFVTVEQRAIEEHRTPGALHQEHHRGDGPPTYRIGRRVLYRRSELEAWRRARLEPRSGAVSHAGRPKAGAVR